ncbi:cell death regulator Aven [Cetorhinus maximus]
MEHSVRFERGRGRRGGRGRSRARGARGPGERQPEREPERERSGGGGGGGGGGGRGWRGARGRSRGWARGRGRGEAASWRQERLQDEDDVDIKEDYDQPNEFSRRQIVSNWDRYKTEEKELEDSDEPSRGTDFNVLLSSAGDSFAQFRFAEEKEWEAEAPSSKQISPLFVDCQSLAQTLQELPLYLRLNVEAELVQITSPAELPQVTLKSVHDGPSKFSQFRAQATGPSGAVHTIPGSSVPQDPGKHTFNLTLTPVTQAPKGGPPAPQQTPDKLDEELDFLLQLETPVGKSNDVSLKGTQDVEALCDSETANTSTDSSGAKVIDNTNSQPAETAKKLDPEDELEDWLDSMIS